MTATSSDPASRAELTFAQALAVHRQGRLEEAQQLYRQTLALQPQHPSALHLSGVIAAQFNDPARAVEFIGRSILANPHSAAAHRDLGLALCRLNRHDEAIRSFDRAIALEPGNPDNHFSRGNALRDLYRLESAVASFDAAIALHAGHARAHNNRGNVLQQMKQFEAALASYDRAVSIEPGQANSHVNRGNALRAMKQYEAAAASYAQGIAIDPNNAAAHLNRGLLRVGMKQYQAAMSDYERAIAIAPETPEAYLNRGRLFAQLKRYTEAIGDYDRAIALKPDYANAYWSQGLLYAELKEFEAALARYDKAIALNADVSGGMHGMRLHAKSSICDWHDFDAEIDRLVRRIERNEAAASPFCMLALSDSPELQRKAAEVWMRQEYRAPAAAPPRGRALDASAAGAAGANTAGANAAGAKIRIGYFSGDFREHPVSTLTAEIFENHDRSIVETTAFSFGPDTRDDMRRRMAGAFDRFIDVREETDDSIALLARQMQIDIAVDLGGFTEEGRPGIFVARAAPLQINYLGYPGTQGGGHIDYLIADRIVIPTDSQRYYPEKIIYLADSCMPNGNQRTIAGKVLTREELGLPPTGFVFCCFNRCYKLSPAMFASWMRILSRIDGAVLWLSDTHPSAVRNLRKEARIANVDPQRLIFAKYTASSSEYLARYGAADLFLDTLPYNAHATAMDALFAGLPVLTCVGESFAGRVGASLLSALGLEALIAAGHREYEEAAIELAANPRRMDEFKHMLSSNRLTAPLFDVRKYVRQLESAYSKICSRHRAGLPPEHTQIDPA
jgi:predicted O-linked N-acetylglucosamine transferase (SPINDLY family)